MASKIYLLPQRPITTIKIIMTMVSTSAVARYPIHPIGVMFANVVSTPATLSPPVTTLFHNRAITNPKAAANEVAIVLRTSAIEILRSSGMLPLGATGIFDKSALLYPEVSFARREEPLASPDGVRPVNVREDKALERIVVTPRDIDAALPIVREVASQTPTVPFPGSDEGVWLKLENLQRLGAFKIRGVWNRLSHLTDDERRRGVSTISSGNHGLAVAWAARRLGIPCTVRVPQHAVGRKVEAIRAQGADVSPISRRDLIDAHEKETWRSWPSVFLHPFAHPATIAGQGTIGREIVEDLADVKTVLVPVGGGGLAAGIATAVKGLRPRAQVFGVQAEGAASLPVALQKHQGHRIDRPRTIADGIGIGIMLPAMAEILGRVLDRALLVSDDKIRTAMRRLVFDAKVVAEPAGAAAFAAWTRYRHSLRSPVVAVVSGGNVDPALFAHATEG